MFQNGVITIRAEEYSEYSSTIHQFIVSAVWYMIQLQRTAVRQDRVEVLHLVVITVNPVHILIQIIQQNRRRHSTRHRESAEKRACKGEILMSRFFDLYRIYMEDKSITCRTFLMLICPIALNKIPFTNQNDRKHTCVLFFLTCVS